MLYAIQRKYSITQLGEERSSQELLNNGDYKFSYVCTVCLKRELNQIVLLN